MRAQTRRKEKLNAGWKMETSGNILSWIPHQNVINYGVEESSRFLIKNKNDFQSKFKSWVYQDTGRTCQEFLSVRKKMKPGRGKKKGRTLDFLWEYFKLQYPGRHRFHREWDTGLVLGVRKWESYSCVVIGPHRTTSPPIGPTLLGSVSQLWTWPSETCAVLGLSTVRISSGRPSPGHHLSHHQT